MRLFLYYSLRSTWNQLRRVFKTWVFLVAIAAIFGGGLIGLSLSKSGSTIQATAEITSATAGLTDYFHLATISKPHIFELAFTVILFSQITIQILASEKSSSRLFLPADINFLFTSDRKPQEILSFRIMSTVGTMLVATIYLLIQAHSLIERFDISGFTAVMLFLAWIYTIVFGVLLKILIYETTCKRQNLRGYLRYILFGVYGIVAFAFYISYKNSEFQVLATSLVEFLNQSWTHAIPIYGWIKGLVFSSVSGDVFMSVLYAFLTALALIAMQIAIHLLPADFYEEATIRSEELALYYEAANQSDAGLLVMKPSLKNKQINRDGFHFGYGASVYFFKPLYNRFRFAKLHIFSKSSITYFIFSVLIGLFSRKFMDNPSVIGSVVLISGLVLFHSILNPAGEDVRKVSFIMNPENTWKKLFYSLAGGTVNCFLDVFIPLLAGSVISTGNLFDGLRFLPFILSVDFFASAANTFLYTGIPTSFDKTFKQVLQILIMYFAFIPDALFIATSLVRGTVMRGFIYGSITNLVVGLVLFGITGVFLDPAPGNPVQKHITKEEKQTLNTTVSIICLALGLMYCLIVFLQLALPPFFKEKFPDSNVIYTMSYFVPTYAICFPLTVWIIKKSTQRYNNPVSKAEAGNKVRINIRTWLSFIPVCFFLMYSGSAVGLILTNLIKQIVHVSSIS